MGARPFPRLARAEGSSAVTFVMALPLLVGLLCGVADIGRAAFLGMEADSAAQAACRFAAERVARGDGAPTGADALSAALEQSPSLSADGVRCSVRVRMVPVQAATVQRRTFDPDCGRFDTDAAQFAQSRVDVELRVDAACLTPVGAVALAAAGSSAELALSATASRTVCVDAPVGKEDAG